MLSFFVFSKFSLATTADSLRVTVCTDGGSDCHGFPGITKTIEHFDSAGNVTVVNYFYLSGCVGVRHDTGFIHLSDISYQYDSASHIILQTNSNFNRDTINWVQTFTYTRDASGKELTYLSQVIFPPPLVNQFFDSLAYDLNGNKIYELKEARNSSIGLFDTSTFSVWVYDSLSRLITSSYYSYHSFTLTSYSNSYLFYDSLSNITSQIGAFVQTGSYDSTRTVFDYDSLNRKSQSWEQRWDTLSFQWKNITRIIYQYDSLSQIIVSYSFYCPDSTCVDTSGRVNYTYDNAGHLTNTHDYSYDFNFTGGGSTTYYDSYGDTIYNGYGYPTENGCGYHNWYSLYYNSNHQLIHTLREIWDCYDYTQSCDYYNLNQDSLLLLMTYPTTVCAFDTVHFIVTVAGGVPPYSYQWSPTTNMLDTNIESPRIITDTTIIYTLTVTDSVGHTQTVFDTLKVYPKNIQPVSITSFGNACTGNPYFLTFNSSSFVSQWSAVWYVNGWQYGYSDTLPITDSGIYSVTVYDLTNGCELSSSSFPVQLFSTDTISISALGAVSFCAGENVTLLADSFPTSVWNTGDSTQSISAISTGNYFAISTDLNGCIDTSNIIHVNVNPLPVVLLGYDTTICNSSTMTLDAGNGYVNYFWQDSSTAQTYFAFTTSMGIDTEFYTVMVIDTNGCRNSDSLEIIFDVCAGVNSISIENGFSIYPNPTNNLFTVKNSSSKEKTILQITNVVGGIVYSEILFGKNEYLIHPNLSSGIYFVREQNVVRKLIVE